MKSRSTPFSTLKLSKLKAAHFHCIKLKLSQLIQQTNFDSEINLLPTSTCTTDSINCPINIDWHSSQNMQTFHLWIVRKKIQSWLYPFCTRHCFETRQKFSIAQIQPALVFGSHRKRNQFSQIHFGSFLVESSHDMSDLSLKIGHANGISACKSALCIPNQRGKKTLEKFVGRIWFSFWLLSFQHSAINHGY